MAQSAPTDGPLKTAQTPAAILQSDQRAFFSSLLVQLESIVAGADPNVVQPFADQVKNAGASTVEKVGMWAVSDHANLVKLNDGFKTRLFGPAEAIAGRIRAYEAVGVDMMLCAFLNFTDELPAFGREVIPSFRSADDSALRRNARRAVIGPEASKDEIPQGRASTEDRGEAGAGCVGRGLSRFRESRPHGRRASELTYDGRRQKREEQASDQKMRDHGVG